MIELKRLSKYYVDHESVTRALDRVDLVFRRGEFVVVTGASGSGKSTLLNVISGLDDYEEGEMLIEGSETSHYSREDFERHRRQNIGFIFQDYNIVDAYTTYENVEAALLFSGADASDRRGRIKRIIERVGLEDQMHQKTSELSGGEKQRVAIARALAKDAPIIIADEPTGNLDKDSGENILSLLKELSEDKLVLLVSHSADIARTHATRHVRLFDGRVIEDRAFSEAGIEKPIRQEHEETLSFSLWVKIALKNLKAMPRRTLFTGLIALGIVVAFSFVYGAYVEQTHAGTTSFHPHFSNPAANRVVVTRDGGAFDETAMESLEAMEGVRAVIPYDTILDERLHILADTRQAFHRTVYFQHAAALESGALDVGRPPEKAEEIIIRGDVRVGETVEVPMSHTSLFVDREVLDALEFEIVGVIEADSVSAVYFHDDFFDTSAARFRALFTHSDMQFALGDITRDFTPRSYVADEDVETGTVHVNAGNLESPGVHETMTLLFQPRGSDAILEESFTISEQFEDEDINAMFKIHPDDLYGLFDDVPSRQAALVVRDGYDAARVMDGLPEEYLAVYPAEYESGTDAMAQVVFSLFLGGVSIGLLGAVYFIAFIALRNAMQSRVKDFIVFRSLGARRKDLYRIISAELLFIMAAALVIVFAGMHLNSMLDGPFPDYIRYYTPLNYLFMVVALLALSLLLSRRFNVRIFSRSVARAFKEAGDET